MSTRPTPERIAKARDWLREIASDGLSEASIADANVLLAATEPPTDEEVANFSDKHYSGLGKGCMVAVVRHFFGPVKP